MAVIIGRDLGVHGRGIELMIVTLVFSAVAAGLVMARVISRAKSGRKLHADDHVIVASVIVSIALTIANFVAADYGYGDAEATLSTHDLHIALEAFYAIQILYKITINLTKISILLLYLRIFAPATSTATTFRQLVYSTLVLVIGYAVASIAATVFQCIPIMRVWDKTVPGTCINLTIFWYANAVANISTDFFTLLLPIGVINGLQLPSRQKWGLRFVFALGLFVCVTSILRMIPLNPASKSKDQTRDTFISTVWTTIEASTAIICACLPMLKGPLALLFPRLFPRGSRAYSSNTPPAASLWSRVRARTPSTAPGTKSSRDTDEGAVAMEPSDFPLGNITKTTDVQVFYDGEVGGGKVSAFPRAHLAGPDYGFV